MKNWLFYIFIGFAAISVQARIINIPTDYPTIQAGIDAAVNGDTVLVAPGTYTESLLNENKNILLTSAEGPPSVTIRGTFRIWGNSVDTTCVVRGLTFTTNDPWRSYPLIEIGRSHNYERPLIVGNILEGSNTDQSGAAIRGSGSHAIIRGNIIRNNRSRNMGGAIFAHSDNVIEGNIISNNYAGGTICESGDAGGIMVYSPCTIRYNLIIDNETFRFLCYPGGGGISKGDHPHLHIYNNTIVGNSADMPEEFEGFGGGVHFPNGEYAEDVVFKNNIVAFNGPGGGVYGNIVEGVYWDYNLVFGNDSADYIGMEPGPHDIQADPQFVDRFSGDYHLLPNSPCIDAGDPNSPLDPDGTRADIGAYYFDQAVGIDEDGAPSGPHQFALKQNYPNPFNAQTIISYSLDKEATVSLHIYSIAGHLVLPLVNKEVQDAGEHIYTWEGRDAYGKVVSTGIYFYELYVDENRESKAMILIK